METKMPQIWFTSDLHISHTSILKHCPKRMEVGNFSEEDIDTHDKWIIDIWNKTVAKKDIVYILGDFSFASNEDIKKRILPKLNGQKFLILGNHDKSSQNLNGYFQQITQIKEVTFKKKVYPFIEENEGFRVVMCHYPMITWNGKHHGVVEVHGHCHGRLDNFNEESTDLRVDVGIDGTLGNYGFVSLEQLYGYFKKKTEGESLIQYTQRQKEEKTSQF